MSFDRFCNHRVSILRQVRSLDDLGDEVLDDYGQPVSTTDTVATVAAGIQPKSARERASLAQAGPVMSTTTIYMRPTDITTADAIHHDPAACPVAIDLPDATYNLVAVRNPAGAGHHLEIDALLVEAPEPAMAIAGGS